LDRTDATYNRKLASPDLGAVNFNHRLFRTQLAADQLVGSGHADALSHTGKICKRRRLDRTGVSRDADSRAHGAGHRMRPQAQCLDSFDYTTNFVVGSSRCHHNEHRTYILSGISIPRRESAFSRRLFTTSTTMSSIVCRTASDSLIMWWL